MSYNPVAPDYDQYGAPTAQVSAQNPTLVPNTDPLLVFDQNSSAFVSPQAFLQLYPRQTASATCAFTGSVTAGDSCSVDLVNGLLPNGHVILSVLAGAGDTLLILAQKLADLAAATPILQALGITAEVTEPANTPTITFFWPGPIGNLTALEAKSFIFTATATVGGTITAGDITTLTFSSSALPITAGQIKLGGSATATNKVSISVTNPGLPNGSVTLSYTVSGGDTLTTIAAALVALINANTSLQALGFVSSSNLGNISYVWNGACGLVTVSAACIAVVTDTIAVAFVSPLPPSALVPSPAPAETITIGGTPTIGEIISLLIVAPGMTPQSVSYEVQVTDTTPALVAAGLAAAINNNANLQQGLFYATVLGAVITLTWGNFLGLPAFNGSVFAAPSETYLIAQPVSSLALSHLSVALDTTTTIATALNAAVNADVIAQTAGIMATSAGAIVTLHWNANLAPLGIVGSVNVGATETVTVAFTSGSQTVTIGGSVTTGDQISVKFVDADAPTSPVILTYTTVAGDTTSTIATALVALINTSAALANAGITASAVGAVVSIFTAGADYIPLITSWVNGQWGVTFAGSTIAGDYVNVAITNAALPGGVHNVQYQVLAADTTLTKLAASVTNAINADATLAALAITATSSGAKATIAAPGAIGTLTTAANTNGVETATISGTPTASETPSITITDAGLPGGAQTLTYTVQLADTNASIAAGFAALVAANAGCIASGITASAVGAVCSIASASPNQTTYSDTDSAHTTITLAGGPSETATAAGAATETATEANHTLGSEVLTVTSPMAGGSGPIIPTFNFQFNTGDGFMMDFWQNKPYLVDFLTLQKLVTQGMPIR